MIVGSVCVSHSPLRDRVRPEAACEEEFNAALSKAATLVAEQKPDIAVVFYPDHINGFFYKLLPPFCVGVEATSIGDYGTAAGKLDVPEARALDLASSALASGIDVAISHDMHVDHGAVQPLEWLSEQYPIPHVIPVFVNCAAPPLPSVARARALGEAVGDWAREAPERILIVGSGGLSHDPPMAELASAPVETRQRLISGTPLPHAQRFARQNRAQLEGSAMAVGQSALLPANAEWDRTVLDAVLAGDLSTIEGWSNESISKTGGRGGHEVRTWIAALAGLGAGYAATELFYGTIKEWLTGMGIVWATAAAAN